jgi:hypothetical protein
MKTQIIKIVQMQEGQITQTLINLSLTVMSFSLINYQIQNLFALDQIELGDQEENLEKQKNHENQEHFENPIFSRIDSNNIIICNFCKKNASYHDMHKKNYCWFHRSKYE